MSTTMCCIACDWAGDEDECESPSASMIGFDEPDCYICPECGEYCMPENDSVSCEECNDDGCYKCTDEWDEWDWKENDVMNERPIGD